MSWFCTPNNYLLEHEQLWNYLNIHVGRNKSQEWGVTFYRTSTVVKIRQAAPVRLPGHRFVLLLPHPFGTILSVRCNISPVRPLVFHPAFAGERARAVASGVYGGNCMRQYRDVCFGVIQESVGYTCTIGHVGTFQSCFSTSFHAIWCCSEKIDSIE